MKFGKDCYDLAMYEVIKEARKNYDEWADGTIEHNIHYGMLVTYLYLKDNDVKKALEGNKIVLDLIKTRPSLKGNYKETFENMHRLHNLVNKY